ncbi:MAG TPA: tetratricopeptide repeat protein, partial [Trichormus sp. M33_DOE_039]|nr:tetratricopeptide repeat protein [Trichormus sp. M33_DOE_039]
MSQKQSQLEDALGKWLEKRNYFEVELAQIGNAGQKFEIRQQIKECEQEIQRLEAEIANLSHHSNSKIGINRKIPFVLPQKDVSTFTGRDEELKALEELLIKRQGAKVCSIVGLAGTGGIGKSGLACHFGTVYKTHFPDGVIGLRVDGKDSDTIARDFARRCGEEIDPEDERDAATIMQDVFAHRRMLLIFDNADNASVIQTLCPGGERCAVIITTRDRQLPILLDIPDEGRINLDPLSQPESLLLLKRLLGEERVNAELESAHEIIQLAGNLPLALQIIGAGLKLQTRRSLADYTVSLREERRLARLRVRGEEHLDIRACFSLSLNQLQAEEIDFFACLSICAEDGFSRRTAMVVGNFDEYTTQDYLDYLCRISLLNYSEVGENRFVFHPLIRLFAHELAIERGLQDAAVVRHAQFFVEFVKSIDLNDDSLAQTLAEEVDDIILAAQWLQQQKSSDYKFAQRLHPFFERYGYWEQAINIVSGYQLLAERNENWKEVIKLRIQQAKYLSLKDEWSKAEDILTPISGIINQISGPISRQDYEVKWLTLLGDIQRRQGKLDEANKLYKRSVNILEQLSDLDHLAIVLNCLGGVLQQQGLLDEAVAVFQRQIEISETLNDQRQLAIGLNCLGGVLQQQGLLDEAVAVFQRRIKISETLDDQQSLAIGLNRLGRVLQQQGHLDEVIAIFQRQIEISETLNDQRQLAIALNRLGGVLQQQGLLDEAVAVFQRRIKISETLDDQQSLAIGLNCLGRVLQQQGHLDEVIAIFQRQIEISETLNDQRQLA